MRTDKRAIYRLKVRKTRTNARRFFQRTSDRARCSPWRTIGKAVPQIHSGNAITAFRIAQRVAVCALPPRFCRIPAATRINLSSILGRAAANRSRSLSISRGSHLLALSIVFFSLFLSVILFRPLAMEPLFFLPFPFSAKRRAYSMAIDHIVSPCSLFLLLLAVAHSNFDHRSRITPIDSILPPNVSPVAIGTIDSPESRFIYRTRFVFFSSRSPFRPPADTGLLSRTRKVISRSGIGRVRFTADKRRGWPLTKATRSRLTRRRSRRHGDSRDESPLLASSSVIR